MSPPVALAAAEWFLLLQSPEATANDHARFEQWCASASEHQMAWQRVQRISGSLGAIPPSLGLQTLQRSQGIDRRTALRSLALLVAAPPAAWLAQRHLPWQAWSADQRTGVGEHRWITLVDGGLVHLNTATAVDVRYDAQLRLLRLRQGEILIQTAQDPAGRSFIVETQQGQIRALGTRFVVRQLDAATQVTVLEHAVEIRAGSAPGVQILHQGQQLRFGSQAPGSVQPASAHADDWSRGIVYADGMRLGDFIAELSRYRPGVLRCDPAVADLKISGAFQLHDIDPVLRSLPRALPVRIVSHTGWWVMVAPAGA